MGEYINPLTAIFIVVSVIVGALLLWTSFTKSGKKWLKNL